jgi:hypothetical protein
LYSVCIEIFVNTGYFINVFLATKYYTENKKYKQWVTKYYAENKKYKQWATKYYTKQII